MGTYSLPRLGLGHSEEVGPRQRAASGRGGCGCGAAGREGGLEVATGVVELEGAATGLFIGEERWWRGRRAVEAGEHPGRTLMALVVTEWRRERRGRHRTTRRLGQR